MTRSDLIAKLAEAHPYLTLKDIELSVQVILDSMSNSLAYGQHVEMRGFGSVTAHLRPPRKNRNPQTGASVMVPAKYAPHFKAGKVLKERVDGK